MRTTISIDDDLLVAAKQRAAERNTTLGQFVEEALREVLARQPTPPNEWTRLPTFGEGGLAPGVTLDDNAALRDLMDEADEE